MVDGGWRGNAEYVRKIINENGGHINAWILTHPHPDHIGAFNVLWKEFSGKTDTVFCIEMDYENYKKKAQEWDGFEEFESFLENTASSDNITYLHTGDVFELCGLSVKVLHAYDDTVNSMSGDLANDGSCMFKLTNKKDSFLFCADVGVSMSKEIIDQYREDLKCDYIQMGHHGNGGLSEEFYRLTQPKAAFFDAPEWLMHPAEGTWFTTPKNREIMESMGSVIYDYSTTPNIVILE